MRRAAYALALVVSLPAMAPAQTPAAAAPDEQRVTLADLEQLALERNPTLRAAQAAIDSARSLASQAGAWPNPIAGFSAQEITFEDRDPRGEYGFFAEQSIPLGGKLRLSRRVFEVSAERTDAELELQRQRVLSAVRTRFYEALAIDRRVAVQERLAALASEAVGVTAQLFNVGSADRPDFLAAEIEARRVDLELTAARNRAFAARQTLAAVVGSAEIASRSLAGSIDGPLPEITREAALRSAIDNNPRLHAARAAVNRARAASALARRQTFPDLFVRGGAAHNRERGDRSEQPIGWQGALEVGVSLPLFNRNAGGIAAAQAEERRAQAEAERLELALRAGLSVEFATYLTAVREAESYRADILPRAEEAYRLYLARYREMGAAYPQVLVAQRSLFELSARYLDAIETAWRSALRMQGALAGDGLLPPGAEAAASLEESRSPGERR